METKTLTPGQTRQEKNKQLIVEQLKKIPIVQLTCEKLGIARSTLYRWKKADEEFAQKVDEAIIAGSQLINDMAESQLINAIRNQNMTAIIFWLKNHHKTYTTKVEVSGKIKTNEKLTPEQEKLVRKALEMASLNTLNQETNKTDVKPKN